MTDPEQTRFIIKKKLGAGAMGDVWLATDTLLNRPVALKYLKTDQEETPSEESVLSEARMLASLNHPSITAIYDAIFDENQNSFCLVMEYVEGKSLADLIAGWSGPLPLEIILEVAIGVLQGLDYAHQKGIVHRDVKPDNVMMQKEGVKLMDFGVAGLMSLLAEGTEFMAGTPAYMSPEQIQGEPTDGRADLYAVGVMLFEMVTGGHYPFTFNNREELFDAHLDQPPRPVREFAPHTPLALERAILRLLAKEPAGRYPSAEAAVQTLRSIQARQKFSQAHLDLLDPEAKPLVGRAEQLSQLQTAWTECQKTATPGLLLVKGEMGIGKSKLVTEFLGRHVVEQGFAALVGRCDESGAPYAPFAQILATIMDKQLAPSSLTPGQVDRLLKQIPGLTRLLSVSDPPANKAEAGASISPATTTAGLWQSLSGKVPESAPGDPWQTQWQFFAAILSIFTGIGPMVIFLENATFLDEASVTLIRFLIRQGQLPLLLLAACRDTKAALPWLDSFAAAEYQVLQAPPLSPPAVGEQLTHLSGGGLPGEVIELIVERSQGNPFQVEEIFQQFVDTRELRQDENGQWFYAPTKIQAPADAFLPQSVLSGFTRQIEKLPEDDRQALAMAALLEPGSEFNFAAWVALLGGETKQALAQRVLDDALKKRLLRQVGDQRYTFRPPDLAKALAATLTQPRQQNLHHQIAQFFQGKQVDPFLVGYHYEKAGLVSEAAHHLETAGTRAAAGNAIDTAIVYYNRAATLVESLSAYKALGELYRQKGKRADSVRVLQRALHLAEETGNLNEMAQILNSSAFSLWLSDRYKEAYQHAAAVLKLPGVSQVERAAAQSHLGMIAWLVGRLAEAETWCQKSAEALHKSGDEAGLAAAYSRLGLVHLSQGKLAEAEAISQRSLEMRQNLGDEWGQAYCLVSLGKVADERGQFDQALAFFKLAQQLFENVHSDDGLMIVYANQGRAILHQGRPDEALPRLAKALQLAKERGKPSVHVLSDIYLLITQASLAQGKIDRARAAADDALKLVETGGNQEHIAQAQAVLGQIHSAQGDLAAAEAMYQRALTLFEQVGSRARLARAQLSYAQFLQQQGQTNRATTIEQQARAEAEKIGLRFF
ncbi:MAG: tetratricopeptide repeat protein [Anaerolineae bacterium]|nr:tetratricopeptide repeat protein [Anaerolineae bacterium]